MWITLLFSNIIHKTGMQDVESIITEAVCPAVSLLFFLCGCQMPRNWLRAVTSSMTLVWSRCGCVLISQRIPKLLSTNQPIPTHTHISFGNVNVNQNSDLIGLWPLWKLFSHNLVYVSPTYHKVCLFLKCPIQFKSVLFKKHQLMTTIVSRHFIL